jgi:hypothetical protein
MSFGNITTKQINDIIEGAKTNSSKSLKSYTIEINGVNCEVKDGKLNVINLAQAFNVNHDVIKEWKTKMSSFLAKKYSDEYESKKSSEDSKSKPKSIIDNNSRYIEPRFAIQMLMACSIEFNNWVSSIMLTSFTYHKDNDKDSIFMYKTKLDDDLDKLKDDKLQLFEQNHKSTKTSDENSKSTKSTCAEKYMILLMPTDNKFDTPIIKFVTSDKWTDEQQRRLTKRADNDKAFVSYVFKFNNDLKLKPAVEKYLKDNDIDFRSTNIQINLTTDFTQNDLNDIKDTLVDDIKFIVKELNETESKQNNTEKLKPLNKQPKSKQSEPKSNPKQSEPKPNPKQSEPKPNPKQSEPKPNPKQSEPKPNPKQSEPKPIKSNKFSELAIQDDDSFDLSDNE